MGGKKRRSKKHKHRHPTTGSSSSSATAVLAAASHGPPHLPGNQSPNHLQIPNNHDPNHHYHSHDEEHSDCSSADPGRDREREDQGRGPQIQDQEMIDATCGPSASLSFQHHYGRGMGFPVGRPVPDDMAELELREAADTLSPLPEIIANSPAHEDMDLDYAPISTSSLSPEARRSQSPPDHCDPLVADPLEVDDDASIYSPSHYPAVSPRFRTERPFDSNTLTSSRSLWAEDLDYFWENGRRYCGNYFMPNDEEEQDRLRIVHQVYLSVFDLELTTAPLEDPKYILDIGTGTGEWAIGMGELFPDCEVVGTDISAIQPSAVPHNVFFEIDDAELEWTRPENCADLIHLRHLSGAFADWRFIYAQAFATVKPGGYIEVLDFDDHKGFRNFFSYFPPDSEIIALTKDLNAAAAMSGRPRSVAHLDPRWLIDAGFVDVTMTEHAIPLSPAEMSTGKLWLVACLCSLEALTLRLLTEHMGWSAERVREVCDVVAQELKDIALNDPEKAREVSIKVRILLGRKPDLGVGEEVRVNGHSSSPKIEVDEDVEIEVDDDVAVDVEEGRMKER